MTPRLLRLAAGLTLLLALPIALIRAQPYADGGLHESLTSPQGCLAPCFMGIRPGVTPLEEALLILDDHEWVAALAGEYSGYLPGAMTYDLPRLLPVIDWAWNMNRPTWIDSQKKSSVALTGSHVAAITVHTQVPLGDMLLIFGPPDRTLLARRGTDQARTFVYYGWYADKRLLVTVGGSCPRSGIYRQAVRLSFLTTPPRWGDSLADTPMCS